MYHTNFFIAVSIVAPLCADQFKDTSPVVKALASGEKVLVDYDLSIQHLYQWFYWAINAGALIGGIAFPWIELNYSYWAAYLLPTCMFALVIMVFVAGNKFYVKSKPTETILIKVYKAFRFSRQVAKRPENKEARSSCKYPLDFAKHDNGMQNSSVLTTEDISQMVWDDQFIEELKQTIMACKILSYFRFIGSAIASSLTSCCRKLHSSIGQMDFPTTL